MGHLPDQAANANRVSLLVALPLLFVVGTFAYSNSFDVPFLFDDFHNIRNNSHIRVTQLDSQYLYEVVRQSPSRRRPVSNLSFALNYYFGEYQVWGFHAVNLGIHLICGILVFLLARITLELAWPSGEQHANDEQRLIAASWIALVAALIFLSHPLQTQAVTYIVQRMTSLATLGELTGLLCYIQGRISPPSRRRWLWWTAAFISWLVALGCKEIAIALPFAVLLYEWFFFQNLNRDWLKRCAIYLGATLAVVAVGIVAVRGSGAFQWLNDGYQHRDFTMLERVMTQGRVVIHYLSLFIWPAPSRLSLTHDFSVSRSLLDPITTLLSFCVLLALLVVAVMTARRFRIVSFAIFWFFLHLALESSILPLELVHEHRMYLPMVGLSLLAAWCLGRLLSQPRVLAIVAVVLVCALTMATYLRNEAWRDPPRFWRGVVTMYPKDARAHSNLASALLGRKNFEEAIKHFEYALVLQPEFPLVHYNLAKALARQGNIDEAEAHYRSAVASKPRFYLAQNELGFLLASQGKTVEAIDHYRLALHSNPSFAGAHRNLARALASQGKHVEAIKHLEQALLFEPNHGATHFELGVLLSSTSNLSGAIQQYRRTLELEPTHAAAHNNLGNALLRQKCHAEAVKHFRQAVIINPRLGKTHQILATVLAMQGQVTEAIAHYQQALAVGPESSEIHFNLALCLESQGEQSAAREHLQTALQMAQEQDDKAMAKAIRDKIDSL